jgi:RNA polymerase II subunit A-like phosphatase
MIDPTRICLPGSVKFPVTITAVVSQLGTEVQKHTPLLRYKYFAYVDSVGPDETEGTQRSRSVTPDPDHSTLKEFHSSFESPVEGTVSEWLVQTGDKVEDAHQPVVAVLEPCTHSVQYGGLCALCGSSLDQQDYTEFNNTDRAPISMSHDTSGLKVSYNEAERIEKNSSERLLAERKLILVVDLDQTVIHAAVDPTIGEWMRDESNPNHRALKDVKTFCLEETMPGIRSPHGPRIGNPPTASCWYYVKLRPGLDQFLKTMADMYEMHIYTMATKSYAKAIASIIDPDGKYFADRILSRDDSGSLMQKSLKRLFPVSTSMVAVIDDRGDVWKWSNNLIKVMPYNFFVGIGDINSSFLPQRNGGIIESSMNRNIVSKLKEDQSPSSTNQPDEGSQEPEEHKNGTEVVESDDDVQLEEAQTEESTEDVLMNTVDQLVAIGGGEDNAELLSVQASERSASLEAQQIERPLARLQEDLEKRHHHQHQHQNGDVTSTLEAESSSNQTNKEPEVPGTPDHVLEDNDTELQHLENALRRVHAEFYNQYDASHNPPDLTDIIPQIRSQVFDNCVILFSGVMPLNRNFDSCDIVKWTRSFGAVVVADLIDSVTHVVAAKEGTDKVRMAASMPRIKIVYTDWLFASIAAWKPVPEDNYLIHVPNPLPFSKEKNADRAIFSAEPEEWKRAAEAEPLEAEDFRRSLSDGHIDWARADKELEEFMASDGDDDEDDDDDGDEDEEQEQDDQKSHGTNGTDSSRKRNRSEPLEHDDLPAKLARTDEAAEVSDDYDDDEFAKELENDLM